MSESYSAERVLIVEDDPATRSGLAELVRAWGFTAEEAADGADALEKITAFRPSIVVTDLVMPRMSGLEVASQLSQTRPGMRILLMSGYASEAVIRHGVPPGVSLLQKPFNAVALARAVRQVLDVEA